MDQKFYSLKVSRIVHLRMGESFTLVVNYKSKEYQLKSELRVFGYTHKIAIDLKGVEILFEPDEEHNYRAVIPDYEGQKTEIDIGLIQAITKGLEAAFNH
jgi:hypothetical protein